MNKKYIDFVPKDRSVKKPAVVVAGGGAAKKPVVASAVKKEIVETASAANRPVTSAKNRSTKLVKQTRTVMANKEVKSAPRPAFVNVEKVKKRPLSKNVYPKKAVELPKEVPSGPVTIIDKPEKDSKVGLVVTIIITIILGAAAGTVAFLLLPK